MSARATFKKNDWVVYPTHGVGKVTGIEDQEIEGSALKLLVIRFDKDRMTLRVPLNKASESGLRKLSSKDENEDRLENIERAEPCPADHVEPTGAGV